MVAVLVNVPEGTAIGRAGPAPVLTSDMRRCTMPTPIERSYLEQGYVLPDGLTWEMVAERRARWDISPIFVPVAVAPSCLGWGVPFVDGRPLQHP